MLRRITFASNLHVPRVSRVAASTTAASVAATSIRHTATSDNSAVSKEELAKAWMQLQYQIQGHKIADFDPLKLQPRPVVQELQPEFYGLPPDDKAVDELVQKGKQL